VWKLNSSGNEPLSHAGAPSIFKLIRRQTVNNPL
jgi:hypothetical protein